MECFLGGGSMASALVVVLESKFCIPGLSSSTLIAPRDFEWGQWADKSRQTAVGDLVSAKRRLHRLAGTSSPPAFSPSVGTG